MWPSTDFVISPLRKRPMVFNLCFKLLDVVDAAQAVLENQEWFIRFNERSQQDEIFLTTSP